MIYFQEKKKKRDQLQDDLDVEIHKDFITIWGKGRYSCNEWKDRGFQQRNRNYKIKQNGHSTMKNTIPEIFKKLLDVFNSRTEMRNKTVNLKIKQ